MLGSVPDQDPLPFGFWANTDASGTITLGAFLDDTVLLPSISGVLTGQLAGNTLTLNSEQGLDLDEFTPAGPVFCYFSMSFSGTLTTLSGSADLSITKTASPSPVTSGGQLTYTLTVTNGGPNLAYSTSVSDPLPQGTGLASATTTKGSCAPPSQGSNGSVNCLLGSLAAGESETITLTVNVTAPAGSTLANTATVGSATSDPNSSNNSATVTTPVQAGESPQLNRNVPNGGAATASTSGGSGPVQAGYAVGSETASKTIAGPEVSGALPFGTAVFSLVQNGNVVSEAGVPASPPTIHGRIFIDYRTGVSAKTDQLETGTVSIDTGVAMVNRGNATANITFTLRDSAGGSPIVGHATLAPNAHKALFIDQLNSVASDFVLPASFPSVTQFGSLDIASDQLLSILALRLTTNQRGETLLTSTPIADLTQTPSAASLFFPQFVDGGGYTTMVVLLNTSTTTESGSLQLFKDDGSPLGVQQVGGSSGSSFHYNIPPGGAFAFQTDGSPAITHAGSAQVVADPGMNTPVGAGVFSFSQGGILVTQSGIPSASPTAHAHIFIDQSGGHDTGLAIANPSGSTPLTISLSVFQLDGSTPAGISLGPVQLPGGGHTAAFAGQFILGLPAGFTGVLDISSPLPFVALTLRSLTNARGDFLLTTFPIADFSQSPVTPLVFPQIANGGGYRTEFILLSDGGAANATLSFFDDSGSALDAGKSSREANH
jgi:uncharacterized repeat protein (TIGR01451 family)